jgi:hypothetical protein
VIFNELFLYELLHDEVKGTSVIEPVKLNLQIKKIMTMEIRRALKYIIAGSLLLFLYGCPSDSDSLDEDIFETSFETYVPVTDNGDGTYNISNGSFRSFFSPRSGATFYQLTVIGNDGTRGNTVTRTPEQLAVESGELMYQITIGSPRIYLGVNEAEKNEAVEFFLNQLDGASENYGSLEVKVIQ